MRVPKRAALAAMAVAVALGAAIAFAIGIPGTGGPDERLATAAPELVGEKGRPLLTEFADFNCRYCQQFHHTILPALRTAFLENGSVEYRYRHFPFLAQSSAQAAEAAECAREQGKFREFQDAIYRLAAGRAEQQEALREGDIATAAVETRLEPEGLLECLESGRGAAATAADKELGDRIGVRGTPTLFLDGQVVRWENYQDLEEQIREAVGKR